MFDPINYKSDDILHHSHVPKCQWILYSMKINLQTGVYCDHSGNRSQPTSAAALLLYGDATILLRAVIAR